MVGKYIIIRLIFVGPRDARCVQVKAIAGGGLYHSDSRGVW
jgi:hypothetical protein